MVLEKIRDVAPELQNKSGAQENIYYTIGALRSLMKVHSLISRHLRQNQLL